MVLAAILIPFLLFEREMTAWSLSVARAAADKPLLLGAILAALLAADVVLPIPSSVLSVLGGAMLGFAAGTAAIWCGMSAGCLVGYAIGRSAGHVFSYRIVDEGELERGRKTLAGASGAGLLVTRAIPVLAEGAVLGAGLARYPLGRFALLTSLANLAVAAAYAAIGAFAMETGAFLLLFAALIAVPVIGWLSWTWVKK